MYAEHVILRHVLSGKQTAAALDPLEDEAPWSNEGVAAAAALLRRRHPEMHATSQEWLLSLPDGAGTTVLRQIWADEALAEVPWDDGCRVLRQQRGRKRLVRLERRLQEWAANQRTTAGAELARLLIEYKILRSDLLGKQA